MSVKLLGIDLTRVDSTPIHEPGTIVSDVKGGSGFAGANIAPTQPFPATGNPAGPSVQTLYTLTFSPDAEFKYVKAGGTIAALDAVRVDVTATDEPCTVIQTSAAAQCVDGISLNALTANQYSWIQVRGRVPVANVTTASAADDKLGSSGTAGRLQTLTTTGTYSAAEGNFILAAGTGRGIIALDAGSSNTAEIYIF